MFYSPHTSWFKWWGNDDHLADKERGLCESFLVEATGRIQTHTIGQYTYMYMPSCISTNSIINQMKVL